MKSVKGREKYNSSGVYRKIPAVLSVNLNVFTKIIKKQKNGFLKKVLKMFFYLLIRILI